MNIEDLVTGDVVLFSPDENSWISKVIVWLTGQPVSHAALIYNDAHPVSLVEETPPAVRVAECNNRFPGRKIYVMRFEGESNLSPVIDISTGFVNNAEPYAMDNLYIAGVIMIYRKITPNTLVQKAVTKILKKIAVEIMEYLNEHKFPGKEPMHCSQMVYECFQQAGSQYHLKITDPSVKSSVRALTRSAPGAPPQPNVPSILDLALQHRPTVSAPRSYAPKVMSMGSSTPEQDYESLARELYEALQSEQIDDGIVTDDISTELLDSVHELGQALDAAKTQVSVRDGVALKGINTLKNAASTFVTPADLLVNTSNLRNIGEIYIPES